MRVKSILILGFISNSRKFPMFSWFVERNLGSTFEKGPFSVWYVISYSPLLQFLNLCFLLGSFYDVRISHLSWPRRTKDFPVLVKNLPDHSKSLVKFMNYLLKVSSFYQSNLRLHFCYSLIFVRQFCQIIKWHKQF